MLEKQFGDKNADKKSGNIFGKPYSVHEERYKYNPKYEYILNAQKYNIYNIMVN